MSYRRDFETATGWNMLDLSTRLTGAKGRRFLDWAAAQGVHTVLRYYASTERPKTLTRAEARAIAEAGLHVLPVFQDRHREPDDFSARTGAANGVAAAAFAQAIGQPEGTTILFAADLDADEATIGDRIAPHFAAIVGAIGGRYRIGAYGSGAVLRRLGEAGLIDVPWLSMVRGLRGTQAFFTAGAWKLRQIPPEESHDETGIGYDRNLTRLSPDELGAFRPVSRAAPAAARRRTGPAPARAPAAAQAGANAYVATEGLNLRAAPNGAILGQLTLGDPVLDLGAATGGWRRVRTGGREGFVFGKYLRPPATREVEALLARTIEEWKRFLKGQGDEKADPFCGYVGEMWAAIGLPYDGRSVDADGQDIPWSAAFISWVVRRAGAGYARFRFSQRHSEFVHDAIQARVLGLSDRPFWGYRRTEQRPALGDIIQKNAKGGTIGYDYAETHSRYPSHSDVVVEVTAGVARVIGGNVGDTVSMRRVNEQGDDIQEYELDAAGFLRAGQGVIALLKNRAHLTGA